jgi:AcrR family transcriptional regulator
VLVAAAELFSQRGWAGTGMRDVARQAGVSVETVYVTFGSKPELFQAAFDRAIVGDDRPVAVAERPEFEAMTRGTLDDRARASARMMISVHVHTAGLQRALREAAVAERDLAGLLNENEERRRADIQRALELAGGHRPSPTVRDGLWALTSFEVFELLVSRSGWSERRYEAWLADTIARVTGE